MILNIAWDFQIPMINMIKLLVGEDGEGTWTDGEFQQRNVNLKMEKLKCYKYKSMMSEMKNSFDRLVSRINTADRELVNLNISQ